MSSPAPAIPELVSVNQAIKKAQEEQPKLWEKLQGRPRWEIYTDGSAPIKNPGGIIGYSAVFLVDKDSAWEISGGVPGRTSEPPTSNNRAEIAGVLSILEVLYECSQNGTELPKTVEIVCDSQYVVNCAQGKWRKHKNKDLWRRFDQLACIARSKKIKLNYRWTRAHVGTEWNERADVLAKEGAFSVAGQAVREERAEQLANQIVYDVELKLFSILVSRANSKGFYQLKGAGKRDVESLRGNTAISPDEAEYQTLISALEDTLCRIEKDGRSPADLTLKVESARDLMLKQITGAYGVKSERLIPLHKKTLELSQAFGEVEWTKCYKKQLQVLSKMT